MTQLRVEFISIYTSAISSRSAVKRHFLYKFYSISSYYILIYKQDYCAVKTRELVDFSTKKLHKSLKNVLYLRIIY